jgi:hypothetical protein
MTGPVPAFPPGLTPRPFLLVRTRDVSGVSGTGVVAEGVVWWDGSASMCWRGDIQSWVSFPGGVSAIEAVHGHGGSTWVHYLPDPDGPGDVGGLGAGVPPGGWVRRRAARALWVVREGCRRAR